MKILSVVLLFATLIVSSFADNASRTKRPINTKRATGFNPALREKLVIAHIKQQLGPYGSSVVADPRFVIDPTIFIRTPSQKPVAPRHRPNYDYVFSAWSKEVGRRFLENNVAAFNCAERKFGVPREIVNGVLNIETQWGRATGKRPVVTTLYTLAVMRPDLIKQGWPEKELITFLAIFEGNDTDLFSIRGSSTGAFGLAQFEPTSYTTLAASCNDDNRPPDLFDNADAICSIGNYLHRSGWSTSEASHRHALFAYNHDTFYVSAILDYADWLTGKQSKHPRYQFFHSQGTKKAATK